jgi:Uncharacterized protein conserved in bacteria
MRSFVCRIVSLVLLASVAPVAAQTYPNRPITIVVGYPPGATSDLLARTVGEPLAAALGQPVLIDNRAGAGGNVAAAYVARAPGDGYTLLVGTDAMMTSNIYLYKNVAFDPVNDVSPITNAGANIICLAVSSQLPVNSVAELIAYARANPGKLSFGSSGTASPHHLSGELLRQMAGIEFCTCPTRAVARPPMISLAAISAWRFSACRRRCRCSRPERSRSSPWSKRPAMRRCRIFRRSVKPCQASRCRRGSGFLHPQARPIC